MSKGALKAEKVEAAAFNSIIQITARVDLEDGVAMVPVRDTFIKMGSYILENSKTNMAYEIRKSSTIVRLTEGFNTAYINNTNVTMERSVMKDAAGIYYVPVSFIMTSAGAFGYDAEYIRSRSILKLQPSAKVKAVQSEMVLCKGARKEIEVEKVYSDIDKEIVTSQCTFATASNDDIVQVGSTSGEVIGKNTGNVEITISYQGKEVDKVIVHVVDVIPKYYSSAYYEQVFESTFRLDSPNYTDGFGAVWKKPGVKASINEGDSMDTGSSLNIQNYSTFESGVTVDLTKLLEDRAIKGKVSTLKIYAKGISEGSKLYITANIKTKNASIKKENSVDLDSKWKTVDLLQIDIPIDAQGLTVDISAGQNEEIRIDAFTITSN